jgi:hypothetical protein
MSETFNLWATTMAMESYPNNEHSCTFTTEELVVLAAHWQEVACSVYEEADFWAEAIPRSQFGKLYYAAARRDRILDLLDERATAEALARADEACRLRWRLSKEDWHVYRHGPDTEREALIDRMREKYLS